MPKQSTYSTFTPILSDYLSATDDPGGTPVHGNVTLTSLRDLLQANLTKATITAAANAEAVVSTGYSLTGSNAQSLVDLSGTWNTTGTPTAIKLNVTDTASNAASKLLDLQVGGTSKVYITKGGRLNVNELNSFDGDIMLYRANSSCGRIGASVAGFSQAIGLSNSNPSVPDVYLYRDAANTLALRNSTNAQAFNVYNTYTDASNYERCGMRWSGNDFIIGSQAGGTGLNRQIHFAAASYRFYVGSGAAAVGWYMNADGSLTYEGSASGFIGMKEQTAPSAPAANGVRIYAEDNGSGKTRLMALFATGAAQQIAIEP